MIRIKSIVIIGLILIPCLLFAQTKTPQQVKRKTGVLRPLTATQTTEEEPSTTPVATIEEEALEKAINPDTYIIGPYDVISVNIWGAIEEQFILTVSPEGNLTIPTVGDLHIGGMSLTSAKSLIKETTMKAYKTAEVNVYLQKLRKFRIPVSGIVLNPGVYNASAADRVSHLLQRASDLISEMELPTTILSSNRSISLIHRGGDTTRVDYLMFIRQNRLECNPYVIEGDAIYVPPLLQDVGTVFIYGAVKIPGEVEYYPGDKLRDIIDLSAGFTEDVQLGSVTLSRFTGITADYMDYELSLMDGSPDWDFSVQPDDRIFIRSVPDFHLKHQVILAGEVKYPGVFSIIDKQTKISEVIESAGGFTDRANLADAELVRYTIAEIKDQEFERLKLIPVADMKETEYEFFKAKSREKNRVLIDLEKLFYSGDSTQDVLLRNRDSLFVPMITRTIRVSGQVINPGILDWSPGKNYLHYINSAGGYSYNARKSKVRVIRASSGVWFKPSKRSEILMGDTIFIPEKPDRDYWLIYKDIIIVASQMATIIILIRTFL